MSKEFSQNIKVEKDNKEDFIELPITRNDISFIVENYRNRFSGLIED